jgi:hypothetical protein
MLSDVKVRLVQIGRLDLLANLGNQIREYYLKLATSPGGMPTSDVYRMAVAVELVGRAERDSGDTDRALKTWTDVREQSPRSSARTRAPRRWRTRDDRAARLSDRHDLPGTRQGGSGDHRVREGEVRVRAAARRGTEGAARVAARRGEPRSTRRLAAQRRQDRSGIRGVLRGEGPAYAPARPTAAAAGGKPAMPPIEEVLALSTSHLKVGTVYQARGDTATAFAEYRAALRLRETLLETQPDNIEVQERVLDAQDTIVGCSARPAMA